MSSDGVHPRREPTPWVVGVPIAMYRYECLLNDVVDPRCLRNAFSNERSNQRRYFAEQGLVGSTIAVLSLPHPVAESFVGLVVQSAVL